MYFLWEKTLCYQVTIIQKDTGGKEAAVCIHFIFVIKRPYPITKIRPIQNFATNTISDSTCIKNKKPNYTTGLNNQAVFHLGFLT